MGNFQDFGQKQPGPGSSTWGSGNYIQKVPEWDTARYDNFQGGYNSADNPQNTPTNASPWSENTYTDRKDRIARCPGTTAVHTFTESLLDRLDVVQESFNFSYTNPVPFRVDGYDADNNPIDIDDTDVEWTCDVGTIDAEGNWTPPAPNFAGSANITATLGELTNTQAVGYAS